MKRTKVEILFKQIGPKLFPLRHAVVSVKDSCIENFRDFDQRGVVGKGSAPQWLIIQICYINVSKILYLKNVKEVS
jgi:hypothetical protein